LEKYLKSRVVHKHDTEENWLKATGFTPKQGEIIIYDIDDDYDYERFKIGDGTTNVNSLPFVLSDKIETVNESINNLSTLVGDEPVSTQISNAVAEKTQVQMITWEETD